MRRSCRMSYKWKCTKWKQGQFIFFCKTNSNYWETFFGATNWLMFEKFTFETGLGGSLGMLEHSCTFFWFVKISQFDGRKSLWTLQWKFFWIYFTAVEAKAFYTKGQFCSSWTNFAISGRKSERALKDINIKAKCQPFNPLKIERKWKFFFNSILAAITFIMTIFFSKNNFINHQILQYVMLCLWLSIEILRNRN